MRRALFVGFLAALLFGGSVARGQSDADLEVARRLYGEGRALEKQTDWEGALAKFRAVAKIKSTAIVRYHQGFCAEKTGHWVEALDAFARAQVDGAGDAAEQDAITASKDAAAELRPRVPRVRVALKGEGASKAEVRIDDTPIGNAVIEAAEPIPVDVGAHVVSVGGDGVAKETRSLTLAEGETKDVSFEVTVTASSEPATTPTTTTPSPANAPVTAPRPPVSKREFGLVFGFSFASITPGGKLHDPSYSQLEYYEVGGKSDASQWTSTGFATELLAGVRVVPWVAVYLSWQHGFLGDGDYARTLDGFSAHTDAIALGAMLDTNPHGLVGAYADLSIAQRWTHTTETHASGDISASLSGLEWLRLKVGVAYKPLPRWSLLAFVFLDAGSYTKMSYDGISTHLTRDIDRTATHTFAGLGLAALYDLPLL